MFNLWIKKAIDIIIKSNANQLNIKQGNKESEILLVDAEEVSVVNDEMPNTKKAKKEKLRGYIKNTMKLAMANDVGEKIASYILNTASKYKINIIDTAQKYGNSENIIGNLRNLYRHFHQNHGNHEKN